MRRSIEDIVRQARERAATAGGAVAGPRPAASSGGDELVIVPVYATVGPVLNTGDPVWKFIDVRPLASDGTADMTQPIVRVRTLAGAVLA